MRRDFFNRQYTALAAVYATGQKMPEERQDVYWEMLKDISEEDFADGVKDCLASLKFFPTIAELGEASMPDIPDKSAPLPAVDEERPTLNWRQQLNGERSRQKRLEATKKINGGKQNYEIEHEQRKQEEAEYARNLFRRPIV